MAKDKPEQMMIEGTGKKATARVKKCANQLWDVRYEWLKLGEEQKTLVTAVVDVMKADGVESLTLDGKGSMTLKTTPERDKIVCKTLSEEKEDPT